jgi:hypothetical protein
LDEPFIPGFGMGLYAGDKMLPGDITKKEIIIPVFDYKAQTNLRCALDPLS